jgi:hypothetical protein
MLGKSEALTDIDQNPYQNYGGERIAGFNPNQQAAFANVFNQTPASQLGSATNLASQAGLSAIGTQGQAGQLGQEALGYGLIDEIIGLDKSPGIDKLMEGFDDYYDKYVLNRKK